MSTRQKRRGGKPALVAGERTEPVTVRLPSSLHDRACQMSIRHGVSVSRVIRVALVRMVNQSTTDAML